MAIFEDCCCCSLKSGCKVLALIAIIFNILSIFLAVKDFVDGVDPALTLKMSLALGVSYGDAKGIFLMENVVEIVLSLVSIAVHSFLIHGVINRKEDFLVPHLMFIPFQCIFYVAEIVLIAIALGGASIKVVAVLLIFVLIYVLAWLTVFSSYQEIEKENRRGNNEDRQRLVN